MRFSKLLLAFLSLAATTFVFMNTYETVFNKDVIFANSVKKVVAQDQINAIIQEFSGSFDDARDDTNSEYKRLESIQIPALTSTLYLEEKRIISGNWYVRPSMGHFVALDKDSRGIAVDYLIYTVSSWQTIAAPNQIEEGMDVKLYHDNHALTMYRVAEKKVLPMETTFVPSKSSKRQLILVIEDPQNQVYYGFSLVQKD
jgi:hypothetical protein